MDSIFNLPLTSICICTHIIIGLLRDFQSLHLLDFEMLKLLYCWSFISWRTSKIGGAAGWRLIAMSWTGHVRKAQKCWKKNKTAVNTFMGLSNVAIASMLWSYTNLCCLDLTAFVHRVRKGMFLFLVASTLWNNQVLLILLLLFPKAFVKPLKSRKF